MMRIWEHYSQNMVINTFILVCLYKCKPMPQHLSSIKIKTPKTTCDQVLKVFRDAQSLRNEKVFSYQERLVGMNHTLITSFSAISIKDRQTIKICLNAPCSIIYSKTKCLQTQKLLHPIAEDILWRLHKDVKLQQRLAEIWIFAHSVEYEANTDWERFCKHCPTKKKKRKNTCQLLSMVGEALRFDTSLLCEGSDAKNGPDLYSFYGLLNQSFSALTLHIQHSRRHPD